jgi:hypothetical protein
VSMLKVTPGTMKVPAPLKGLTLVLAGAVGWEQAMSESTPATLSRLTRRDSADKHDQSCAGRPSRLEWRRLRRRFA